MNREQQEHWQFAAIQHVLMAMGTNPELRRALVFKGALVLNRRLGTSRMSLDIDANLDVSCVDEHPDRESQKAFLAQHLRRAISAYFEAQDPVRYELQRLRVDLRPKEHPFGWSAFAITASLVDHANVNVAIVRFWQDEHIIPISFPLPS
jgi:hypothetical protein